MTDKKPDGGQAFPSDEAYGMSLRDYFAAQALGGFLANEFLQKKWTAELGDMLKKCAGATTTLAEQNQKFQAETAYQFADAMLEARKK